MGVTEVARLRQVFALEMGGRRLEAILRAVLVKSAEDSAVFKRVFEAWLGRAEQDLRFCETSRGDPLLAPPDQKVRRPRLRRHLWRVAAAGFLSVLSFTIYDDVNVKPIKKDQPKPEAGSSKPVPAQADSSKPLPSGPVRPGAGGGFSNSTPPQPSAPTPDDIRRRFFTTIVPILTITPAGRIWQVWIPLALGFLALATASGLWLSLRKRSWFPPPTPEPSKKGPPRVFLTPPPLAGPQLLEAREEDSLVWGVGHFVAEEPTRRLDLLATVGATARAVGIPHLRFHQARYPREVWLWVDEAADDPALFRLASEVESALQTHNLPVARALFRGIPDWLVSSAGQAFAPNEVDERRDASLVAILTDGRVFARQYAADDRRARLDALLRSLSHWPRLAFVDFAAESSDLAALLPKHSLARITPPELAAFLGSDEALQRRAVAGAQADAVWAAACAFAPSSIDELHALELRRSLGLVASTWGLRTLRAEAPGPPGRLQWRALDRARRINWLREIEDQEKQNLANGSFLGQALAFWENIYDQELKDRSVGSMAASWRGALAYQRLVMERALLSLWRTRDAPGAIRELYRFHGSVLRESVERHLCELSPLDWGKSDQVRLLWLWADRTGAEQVMLQKSGLGGGMPLASLRQPGRLWLGVSLGIGLGLGALVGTLYSSTRPSTAPPLLEYAESPPVFSATWFERPLGGGWHVLSGSPKWLSIRTIPEGASTRVDWRRKKFPCVEKPMEGVEIWRCGTGPVSESSQLSPDIWQSLVIIEDPQDDPAAAELAGALLDSGSADIVYMERSPPYEWRRGADAAIPLRPDQQVLILTPFSKTKDFTTGARLGWLRVPDGWNGLTEALRFDGVRNLREVWPALEVLGGDSTLLLLRGLGSCRTGEAMEVDGMTFVHICGGSFTMGSAASEPGAYPDEQPAHQVTLSGYWIGKTEVTIAQYSGEGSDTHPAADLAWDEANTFCEGHGLRLPSEAEWEYAARAGTRTAWSFGDDEKHLGVYAWFDGNSGGRAHPVGTRLPNPWGIYDMHGNVWEWVADWNGGRYPATAQENPAGPKIGTTRVFRGGSFDAPHRLLRSAGRDWLQPSVRERDVGFRCARGLSPPDPLSHRPAAARERGGG